MGNYAFSGTFWQIWTYRYMEETGIHLPTVCKESLVQVQPCPSQLGHHGHHHPLIHDHWCDPGPGEWPTWGAEACQVASCLDRSQSFASLCWTALFYFVPQESDRQSGLAIWCLSFQVPRWIPVLCYFWLRNLPDKLGRLQLPRQQSTRPSTPWWHGRKFRPKMTRFGINCIIQSILMGEKCNATRPSNNPLAH